MRKWPFKPECELEDVVKRILFSVFFSNFSYNFICISVVIYGKVQNVVTVMGLYK